MAVSHNSNKPAIRKKVADFNNAAIAEASRRGITLPNDFFTIANAQYERSGESVSYGVVAGAIVGKYKFDGVAAVADYANNPKQYVSNAVRNLAYDYSWRRDGTTDAYAQTTLDRFNTAVRDAAMLGVSVPSIQSAAQAGSRAYGDWKGGPDMLTQVGAIAMPIAMTFALPGIGQSIGANLLSSGVLAAGTSTATATAIGTAMASIAVQAGQGIPLETAIKNAGVNLIVQTGATSAATQLNNVIKNPAVTDALVSAGASAVKTVAAGGSAEDIKKNIVGAVAGSATTSATGSNVAGSTVGGAVSGGVTGALSGAASALGTDAAKPKDTTTPATTTSSSGPSGIQLAQADTGTVSDAGNGISAGTISGTPIFADSARAANVKTPVGFGVMPIEMADNKPAGSYFDYTQNAWIAPIADIQKLESVSGTSSTSTPSSPPTVTSEGYTPTITTPTSYVTTPSKTTSSPVSADKPILDLIASTTPNKTEAGTGTGTATSASTTTGTKAGTSTGTTGTTGTGTSTKTSTGTGTGTGTKTDVGTTTSPAEPDQVLPEVVVTASPDSPLPVDIQEEKGTGDSTPASKYKPNLRIYGGTTPSTLSQSLGTGGTYSTGVATTGLTGSRGAGEIESKETGKKRKNVWNEASLRLKDALGV